MTSDTITRAVAPSTRLPHVDAWRFVAIALMVVDHVAGRLGGLEFLRYSVGRLAMPLFFLLAGMLVRRLSERHLITFGLGVALPLVVPWVDMPNVLVWYVLGTIVLVSARRCRLNPLWVALPALVLAANGFDLGWAGGYRPLPMVGLMGLGAAAGVGAVPRLSLPAWCVWLGRHSLGFYVAHLLALEAVARVGGWPGAA